MIVCQYTRNSLMCMWVGVYVCVCMCGCVYVYIYVCQYWKLLMVYVCAFMCMCVLCVYSVHVCVYAWV